MVLTKLLGHKSEIPTSISHSILDFLPRNQKLPPATIGTDVWNCYEFHCQINNKLQNFVLSFSVNCHSMDIIESKSLKLYLGAFYQYSFLDQQSLIARLMADISSSGINIENLALTPWHQARSSRIVLPNQTICEDAYGFSQLSQKFSNHINLNGKTAMIWPYFRSICPVTEQPDLAWIVVICKSQINQEKSKQLQQMLLSFREKGSFHESCADDIWAKVKSVDAIEGLTMLFNRRGGIEINPSRGWVPSINLQSGQQ